MSEFSKDKNYFFGFSYPPRSLIFVVDLYLDWWSLWFFIWCDCKNKSFSSIL